MIMGPCGGVRPGGGCEVLPFPCVFPAPVAWPDPVPPVPLDVVPLILTDFSSEPYSVSAHATVAGILAPVSDAVLVGEHQDRPDFPPQPPPDWAGRAEAVERELHRRYGPRPELAMADEQSRRIGELLSSGQLTCQVILLRAASPGTLG